MANFRHLEPGSWWLDTGDEFFTPSRTSVDPRVPLLPLETAPRGPILPPVIMAPMSPPQSWGY